MDTEKTQKKDYLYKDLTYEIIGAAKEVYHELGGGLLESLYEDAFCYELQLREIPFLRQPEIDVHYKDMIFKNRFRADVIVNEKVLIENKAIQNLTKIEEAQLLNYLHLTHLKLGLLLNFGVEKFQVCRRIL